MFRNIGFIGTGNMGGTIATAVYAQRNSAEIYLADTKESLLEQMSEKLPGSRPVNAKIIAACCDLIFLGVKPQVLPLVLEEIRPVLSNRTGRFVLATMAAGVPIDTVLRLTDESFSVIRLMPNTPLSVGKGVIEYCGKNVTENELSDFASLLSGAALTDRVPEHLIDAASAVTGCGPAYVYLFIEALADGAVACGLPRDKALAYAAATVEGSARMVLDSGLHPGALKDMVCSPGGTTIQGVRALENQGFRAAAMESVIKAYEKTLELKK